MTSIKKFVDVGDLAAPIESRDWCRAVHHGLRITSRQTDKEVRQLKYAMLEFRNKERWKKLVDNRDKPFRSWQQYVSYPEPNGLGLPVESVDAIIRALDNELIGHVACNAMLDVTSNRFTVEDMRRFAGEAWGPLGVNIVERWCEYNATYFTGALRPVPLVLTHTQPYGALRAFCSYNPNTSGRTITLNVPKIRKRLLADNNTLVHEMVHQLLFERGEDPHHASEGWRREIMRLTKQITGKEVWAGRSKTVRRDKRVVRINVPHPETNEPSLSQDAIARWPREGLGIDLGCLGSNT
jgi:hypothetical protein